jgi:hypothetical protein
MEQSQPNVNEGGGATPGERVVAGESIGRNRHTTHAASRVPVTRRCLTCKRELAPGVERYCNDACLAKNGRTKRSPGRTAAHRRRRRGGLKG